MTPAASRADILPPLASLLSKCEKSQGRLTTGTWQHARLQEDVAALCVALALLTGARKRPAKAELLAAWRRLGAMAAIARKAKAGFEAGTPQHTLQRNRLAALVAARRAVQRARQSDVVR